MAARLFEDKVRPWLMQCLSLTGVNTFYGKAHILHDLSFHVGAGEVVALLGRNGAGKTTTMRIDHAAGAPGHGHGQLRGRGHHPLAHPQGGPRRHRLCA